MDVFNLQATIGLDISGFEQQLSAAMEGAEKLASAFTAVSARTDALSEATGRIVGAFGQSNAAVQKGSEYYTALQSQLSELESESKRASDKVEAIAYALNKSAEATGIDSEETKALAADLKNAEAEASRMQAQANALRSRLEGAAEATKEESQETEKASGTFSKLQENVSHILHPFKTLSDKMQEASDKSSVHKSRMQSLGAEYQAAKKTVESLTEKYKESVKSTGATSEESRRLAQELEKAESTMANAKSQLSKYNSEVKDTDSKSKEASKSSSDFGATLGTIAEKAASAVGALAKISAAAVGAGATAVAGLAKQSLDAYASYEQLVGGVQTLFGAQGMTLDEYAKSVGKSTSAASKQYDKLIQAENTMLENADKAYMTAGLSANEYMETAIQFSASLIQGLNGDTQKAAGLTDQAIRDMSDNVNKMGTSLEAAQNAYRGLARNNYTMLDNLALGYQGSAEEMARLINDSKVMGDGFVATAKNVKDISFDKYIEAIHVIQENLGITGTTSKEAAGTIEGSVRSMGAAWENLKTNLATGDDAKVNSLIDNLVAAVETAAQNIIPRLEIILDGIAKMIDRLVPMLAEKLPGLVNQILPSVIGAGTKIIKAVVKALPTLLKAILPPLLSGVKDVIAALKDVLPDIISAVKAVMPEIISAITEALPLILEAGGGILLALVDGIIENIPKIIEASLTIAESLMTGLINNLPKIIGAGLEIIITLADAITDNIDMVVEAAVTVIDTLVTSLLTGDNLASLLDAGLRLLMSIADAIVNNLPKLIETTVKIIQFITTELFKGDNLKKLINAGVEILTKLVDAIVDNIDDIFLALEELVTAIWDYFSDPQNVRYIFETGVKILAKLIEGLGQVAGKLAGFAWDLFVEAATAISNINWWELGKSIVTGILSGITGFDFSGLFDEFGNNLVTGLKDIFGIHSPSKVMRDEIGKYLAIGIGEGFNDEADAMRKNIVRNISGITSAMQVAIDQNSPEITMSVAGNAELQSRAANATAAFSQNAMTSSSGGLPYNQNASQNVSFAGAEIQIIVNGAERSGAEIADEIAQRLAYLSDLENLKAGVVGL